MHEDRNILIVCHHWSWAFIFHPILCSFSPPAHLSLWYPLSLPHDSFHILLSHVQAHTPVFVRSPNVSDGLIKCCRWSRLVAWALIESSCLCNDCYYFINPQHVCVYVRVSVQLYTLATTHPDRQAKCTVTQQVTGPCHILDYLWTGFPLKHCFTLQSCWLMGVLDSQKSELPRLCLM